MKQIYLSFLFVVSVENVIVRSATPRSSFSSYNQGTYGDALFLTPILEKGKSMEAKRLSMVRPKIGNLDSYSGYLTVNKKCQSNLFFWFFPAKNYWKQAPVMLWLQGGPGSTSLYGLFEEIGPFSFKNKLKQKEFSWNEETNLLFIDQPVGAGYSFTGKGCYATNETQVSEDLYSALVQFFQLFPEIKSNKFILAGESYAGHYIPAIGYKIHQSNQHNDFKINLKVMMIGNGWLEEKFPGNNSELLLQIGLLDLQINQKAGGNLNFLTTLSSTNKNYRSKNFKRYDEFNYIKFKNNSKSPYENFVVSKAIRKSIHVGNQSYDDVNDVTYSKLINERTKINLIVEELLEHYPIVFYNGQLDTVCPYSQLVKFLRGLNWSGSVDYERATRYQWCEGGVLAGYYKSARNLHEVMVRDAGHMVPKDQPLWAFKLASSVINNPPDNPLRNLPVC